MRYNMYSGVENFKSKTQKIMLATIALAFGASLALSAILPARAAIEGDEVVVNAGNLAIDLNSWYFFNDNTNMPSTAEVPGEYEFVEGPGTPPMGKGSIQFQPEGNDRWNIATAQHAGTKLKDISYMKYQTYQPSTGNPGVNQNAVFLNIDVDFNGSDADNSYQNRLVFVPRDNGTVVQDQWQLWNAGTSKGMWRWSKMISGAATMWPDGNTNALRSWPQIVKAFPHAEMHDSIATPNGPVPGQLLFRGGEPYPAGFTGSVDKFVFGVGATKTIYNFEPTLSPTSEQDCLNRGWKRFNAPVFASQAECIEYVLASQAPTYVQGCETDTSGWLDTDDAWYGTASRAPSGTAGITSSEGSWHCVMEGDGTSAPFSRFDMYRDTWTGDWTAEIDVYLDPSWSSGTGFDYSVAANGSDNMHQRDYIFHVTKDTSTGNLLVAGSNNTNFAPREDLESINNYQVTTAGWYTLQHTFRDQGGALAVDLNLLDSGGNTLFTETRFNAADTIPAEVGGNRYAWFTFINVAGGVAVDEQKLDI